MQARFPSYCGIWNHVGRDGDHACRAMRDGDQRYRLSSKAMGLATLIVSVRQLSSFPKTNNPVDAASPHVATTFGGRAWRAVDC